MACDASKCLTCTSPVICLSCAAGKYLTGSSTCDPCINNCQTCTAATNCQACVSGYTYTAGNNSCWLDCSSISSCLTCHYTTSLICDSCDTGFTLNSNNCVSNAGCPITNCATCTATECLTCDAGYGLNNNQCTAVCGDGAIIGS